MDASILPQERGGVTVDQSKSFWAAFALLCGACLLSVANPCVGAFAVLYLVLVLAVVAGYLVMRSRAHAVREGRPADDERESSVRAVLFMSRALFGIAAMLTVFAAVFTCVLTMIGLSPDAGARQLLPVQLAPLDAAFDLWAVSAVMSVAAAVLLVAAGGDVRRWLRRVA